MPDRKADAVVIGGGVIGTSIAYHLAEQKAGVILLEKGGLASGSSGACDGLVFLQSKKPGLHLKLALASLALFHRLAERLPLPVEFRQTGGLVVIESQPELESMEDHAARQQGSGLDVSLLDEKETRRLEPALAEHILGAAHSPLDGQVNPIRLTLALALGAKNLGARIITGERVTGLTQKAGKTWSVTTDRGGYQAGTVINAAGVMAPEIGRMVGLEIPIKPRRGQIIVTQAAPPLVGRCLISAGYIAAKYDPEAARENNQGVSVEQTDSGNLLLGSTREFVGFDHRTTLAGLRNIAAGTTRLIPRLAGLNVIRSFAGLRPYTPDGLPILGRVDGLDGFIMAAGHEGDGIALSPITGRLIAQLVASGRAEFPLTDFRLERFTSGEERS